MRVISGSVCDTNYLHKMEKQCKQNNSNLVHGRTILFSMNEDSKEQTSNRVNVNEIINNYFLLF